MQNKELDRIDFEIIDYLQNNARMTNKDLARRVGLAPSSCHARVQALQASGVFKGFHAVISEDALGIGQEAVYFISLVNHSRGVCETFITDMMALPEVQTVFLVSGKTDFVMHVVVRDTEHLRNFALDHITLRPEVTQIETALVFEKRQQYRLPDFASSQR